MSANLSTRTAYLNIVISLKDFTDERINNLTTKLNDFCIEKFTIYAFILHDRDILEDGSLKTKHIHLVGIYNTNRQRLSTILSDLSCHLCINALAISIDKCNDLNGSIQYLVHANNPCKFRYDVTNIVTNISSTEMEVYMSRSSKSLSTSSLLDLVKSSQSKLDVYSAIGLEYYRQYRQVINDLWFEIHEKPYLLDNNFNQIPVSTLKNTED